MNLMIRNRLLTYLTGILVDQLDYLFFLEINITFTEVISGFPIFSDLKFVNKNIYLVLKCDAHLVQ